jgi:hypothetical protein
MWHWDMNQQIEMKMGVSLSKKLTLKEVAMNEKRKLVEKVNYSNIVKSSIHDFFKIDINQKTRKREVVEARFMFYELCRRNRMSLSQIGRFVGKDHATVLHGTKRFEILCEVDVDFEKNFQALKSIVDFRSSRKVVPKLSGKSLSHQLADALNLIEKLENEIDTLRIQIAKCENQ